MSRKKEIRMLFNVNSKVREKYRCRLCSAAAPVDVTTLEVHHIVNRNLMPNGGYVKENGITLCPRHHEKVEKNPDFYPTEFLFGLIGSSYDKALRASERLSNG